MAWRTVDLGLTRTYSTDQVVVRSHSQRALLYLTAGGGASPNGASREEQVHGADGAAAAALARYGHAGRVCHPQARRDRLEID